MKLEGSLDAFSLPDVFQLLSLTKKSGGLHLTNGQASGVVYFADGAIAGASSDASRQALARRIVGLGAADDAALRRAVERASSEGTGVARALVEAGAVDAGLVQQLALEQAIDAVFDLLRWPNGDFAFAIGEDNPDGVGLSVGADIIVNEATERRDSWESLARLIPSPEVVLTMPVVAPEAPSLAADEWALLSLIDGVRSVGELVDVSGAGQFSVVSTLGNLVQRGLLVICEEESPDHISLVRRRQQLLAPLEPITDSVQPDASAPGSDVGTAAQPITATQQVEAVVEPVAPQAPQAPQQAFPQAPAAEAPAAQAPAQVGDPGPLGGAHDPANVVPPRPEPFIPKRVVDHPEPARAPGFAPPAAPAASVPAAPAASVPAAPAASVPAAPAAPSAPAAPVTQGIVAGVATAAQPVGESAIERDPTVNRSLMLRLIAGVRGL